MEELKIQYIKDFLNNPKIFFEGIYDQGTFKKEEFHKFTKTVFEINNSELSDDVRNVLIPIIWEISFKIQEHLTHHVNPIDGAHFVNLEEDDVRQISNIIYYISNLFTFGKPIEKEYIKIGSW